MLFDKLHPKKTERKTNLTKQLNNKLAPLEKCHKNQQLHELFFEVYKSRSQPVCIGVVTEKDSSKRHWKFLAIDVDANARYGLLIRSH